MQSHAHMLRPMRPTHAASQALMLSDELKLDEVTAVELLITAAEEVSTAPARRSQPRRRPAPFPDTAASLPSQRGSFTAESAAGIFFEERQNSLKCLLKLLADVVSGVTRPATEAGPHPYTAIIRAFVDELLDQPEQGQQHQQQPPGAQQAASSAAASGPGQQRLISRLIAVLKVRARRSCPPICTAD